MHRDEPPRPLTGRTYPWRQKDLGDASLFSVVSFLQPRGVVVVGRHQTSPSQWNRVSALWWQNGGFKPIRTLNPAGWDFIPSAPEFCPSYEARARRGGI